MLTVFAICAGVGSVILLLQLLFMVVGLGGEDSLDADLHADSHLGDAHDSSWFFGVLSFKSLVAALAFFGLAGMGGELQGWPLYVSMVLALGAGTVAMIVVAWLMRLLYRLNAEGTVRIENTVGSTATVYLTVPGRRGGAGKVTVRLQNRTMEYAAVTDGDDLRTGMPVMVVGMAGPDLLEVASVDTEQEG